VQADYPETARNLKVGSFNNSVFMNNRLFLILMFFGLMISSAVNAQKQAIEWSETYLRENIAFTNITGRSISAQDFVYEMKVTDFKKTIPLPTGFGLNGKVFSDNGQGFDLVKGDGIYTSHEAYQMDASNARVRQQPQTVFDESFKYGSTLKQAAGGSTDVSGPGISCKIRKCGCPCSNGSTCPACEWWGWQCLQLYDCVVTIGF